MIEITKEEFQHDVELLYFLNHHVKKIPGNEGILIAIVKLAMEYASVTDNAQVGQATIHCDIEEIETLPKKKLKHYISLLGFLRYHSGKLSDIPAYKEEIVKEFDILINKYSNEIKKS